MKIERFFDKFEQFVDTPNAIEKLRELVLNLAIHGRLVDNCAENPLSIDQIRLEKERALLELDLRSHPEPSLPIEDDFPFALPESWNVVSLGDLLFSCPTSYGEDPSASLVAAGVVKVGNINNQGGFKGEFAERWFAPAEIESLLARQGELMVVKSSGSAENVHSGKTALCRAEHDRKIVASNFVLRLRAFGSAAIPEYLWRLLTSRYSRAWVEKTVQTMTYPNLKWSDLAHLPVPLPPLAEQKRIVAKVDEFMALCDRLEAQLRDRDAKRVPLARASLARFSEAPSVANIRVLFHDSYTIEPAGLRRAILNLAIRGRLVPHDAGDESAMELVAKISARRVELAKAGHLRGPTIVSPTADEQGDWKLPHGWLWVRFGQIVFNRDGERVPVSKEERVSKKKIYDYYGASGVIDKTDDYLFDKPLLLIGEDGANLINRATPIAFMARGKYWVNNHAHVLDGISEDFLRYIEVHINAINLESYLTGSAQPKMNQAKMNTIPIALPPLAEQVRIVARVDQLMALVDQLEAHLDVARAASATLMEAVVAELTTMSLAAATCSAA